MQLFNAGHLMSESEHGGATPVSPSTLGAQQKNNAMPGAQLAAYRRAQGKSVEEIANLLKLTPRQIVALESDNYALLPGPTIVRGFIRAYAKILKVNADSLIAMMAPESPESVMPIASSRTLSTPLLDLRRLPSLFINRRHTSLRWVMSSLVFVLAVIFFVQRGVGGVAQTFGTAAAKVTSFTSVLASSSSSSSLSSSSPAADVVSVGESLQLAAADGLVSLNQPVVNTENTENSQKRSLETTVEKTVEISSQNLLVLKVHEDSWIEIRKMNRGGTLVSRLFKAGTSETFNIDEPMFMVIGNPTGVEASLRGVPLEMKRASNSKIARINLK